MDCYQYRFTIEPALREVLLAFLADLPFDAFEEEEEELIAFCSTTVDVDQLEENLSNLAATFPFKYEKKLIPYQNWNAIWEENFNPIIVDTFCAIRADFHPSFPQVEHEILIHPKMAFGTGHHATTLMMIQMMRELQMEKAKVLDFGCGTGILAILASKMGALLIDAVDIEQPAFENTIENCQINDVDNVQVYFGGLDTIHDNGYDIILANINRNVILSSLDTLYKKLKRSGVLLISGILIDDEVLVLEKVKSTGFTVDVKKQLDQWSCISLLS